MEITDIKIRKLLHSGKIRAFVSITFNDAFVVHDIKIIKGQTGYFIAMPSRRLASGEYRDIAHPINSEARIMIQKHILEAYFLCDSHEEEELAQTDWQ